jgi:DNA-directed RNA polymerase subunit L
MKKLASEKDYLEILFEKEDQGFVNLVAEKLLESKNVSFAASLPDHPLTKNPVLKVKGKNLEKEIAKALDAVKEEAEEFEKALKK